MASKTLPKCPKVERCRLCGRRPNLWYSAPYQDGPDRGKWFVKCEEPSCPMCISHRHSGLDHREWNLLQCAICEKVKGGKVVARGYWRRACGPKEICNTKTCPYVLNCRPVLIVEAVRKVKEAKP